MEHRKSKNFAVSGGFLVNVEGPNHSSPEMGFAVETKGEVKQRVRMLKKLMREGKFPKRKLFIERLDGAKRLQA